MRKVFFSFHYQRDSVRASQVRNSNVVTGGRIITSEFVDKAKWETLKRISDDVVKRWIAQQLNGTSVTVVLVGYETANREWVKYEIDESIKRGNGLVAIHIHNCPHFLKGTDPKGVNPFDRLSFNRASGKVYLSSIYKTYDWINDNGRDNLGRWIEEAAIKAGK